VRLTEGMVPGLMWARSVHLSGGPAGHSRLGAADGDLLTGQRGAPGSDIASGGGVQPQPGLRRRSSSTTRVSIATSVSACARSCAKVGLP